MIARIQIILDPHLTVLEIEMDVEPVEIEHSDNIRLSGPDLAIPASNLSRTPASQS